MINNGADVNARANREVTPLAFATARQDLMIVDLLKAKGAKMR